MVLEQRNGPRRLREDDDHHHLHSHSGLVFIETRQLRIKKNKELVRSLNIWQILSLSLFIPLNK